MYIYNNINIYPNNIYIFTYIPLPYYKSAVNIYQYMYMNNLYCYTHIHTWRHVYNNTEFIQHMHV